MTRLLLRTNDAVQNGQALKTEFQRAAAVGMRPGM